MEKVDNLVILETCACCRYIRQSTVNGKFYCFVGEIKDLYGTNCKAFEPCD